MKLIGPFKQIITLNHLSLKGKLKDEALEIFVDSFVAVDNDKVVEVGTYEELSTRYPTSNILEIEGEQVLLPAFVDAHTHICFGGNRAKDFAMRNAGKTYLEIAEAGGGIWSSVKHTREASEDELLQTLLQRINYLNSIGIATIEVKSGYGLNVEEELKMLRIIDKAQQLTQSTLVPTCLAAHLKPKDFEGDNGAYLSYIVEELLPKIKEENLTDRVDIFIEKSAFLPEESKTFLEKAKKMGFQLTVHADQFTPGSSRVAVEVGAKSADHLEATADEDIAYLANSNTVAIALPGASIGLGDRFAPARKLLDAGAIVAIASDWNPGSAPMGDLIAQASILATFQKLSTAEVLSAITFRAAYALGLEDRGRIAVGQKADFVSFETNDFQNILYYQGRLSAKHLFINGELI